MFEPRQFLRSLFDTAVAAATPENCMRAWIPAKPAGRVIVVGAGKAAASMAKELEDQWSGPLEGSVIVPYGHGANCRWIEVIEASHPVPDEAGVAAAAEILRSVSNLSADDTVVCLISGGGSSLLCLPAEGVSLDEKQNITSAACAPATVVTLIISDVPGNDVSMVASGPTIADGSSAAEALEILDRYAVSASANARTAIGNSTPLKIAEGDIRILATSDDAMLATAALTTKYEITPYTLGDLTGDARSLGIEHAELAMQIAAGTGPVETPCVILSAGETTVKVRGDGRGGRNGEYALSLAIALNGHPRIHAIACDTDGIDGGGDNAGNFVTPDILARASAAGVDAEESLERNDSYAFFTSTLDLVVTGPTRTNVNDFRAIFIADKE